MAIREWHGVKVGPGLRDLGTRDPLQSLKVGPQDPLQNLKVGPRSPFFNEFIFFQNISSFFLLIYFCVFYK